MHCHNPLLSSCKSGAPWEGEVNREPHPCYSPSLTTHLENLAARARTGSCAEGCSNGVRKLDGDPKGEDVNYKRSKNLFTNTKAFFTWTTCTERF